MTPTQCCPECEAVLSTRAVKCRCGWKLPVVKQNEPQADGRCEYVYAERRCPLPGTRCQHPYSKGPWYCVGHVSCLDNPRLGEAVLRYVEENYQAILAKQRDWRDMAIAERLGLSKNSNVKPAVSKTKSHPHILHTGDETNES